MTSNWAKAQDAITSIFLPLKSLVENKWCGEVRIKIVLHSGGIRGAWFATESTVDLKKK